MEASDASNPDEPPSNPLPREDPTNQGDICRHCRGEGSPDQPLFYPCACTGSIKFIHQNCLLQWLDYSKKEICDLCQQPYSFTPIYSPEMPRWLPLGIFFKGILERVAKPAIFGLRLILLALIWLGLMPMICCRIYQTIMTLSISPILSLPMDIFSMEKIGFYLDFFQGFAFLALSIAAFLCFDWIYEHILLEGGPEWLGMKEQADAIPNLNVVQPQGHPRVDPVDVQAEDAPQRNLEIVGNRRDLNPVRILDLGLDIVFCFVLFNIFLVLTFAFCPYHVGLNTLIAFKLMPYIDSSDFKDTLSMLMGYCTICFWLLVFHTVTKFLHFKRSSQFFGLCYIAIKVALLMAMKIVGVPILIGFWLDICSLALFDAALEDRLEVFYQETFYHWLSGIIFLVCYTSFLAHLQTILRPGVFWFMPKLNDLDYNPIKKIIHVPLLQLMLRVISAVVMCALTIFFTYHLPSQVIAKILPDFLPYQTSFYRIIGVWSKMIFLLGIPFVVRFHDPFNQWVKNATQSWCSVVAKILDLRSYLLPKEIKVADVQNEAEDDPPDPEDEGLAVVQQALMQKHGSRLQTYEKPKMFPLKIFCLFVLMMLSWLVICLALMLGPVWLGRQIFSFWDDAPYQKGCQCQAQCNCQCQCQCQCQISNETHVFDDLIGSAFSLCICFMLVKGTKLAKQGWQHVARKIQDMIVIVAKATFILPILFGLVPLLVGAIIQVYVMIPMKTPLNKSPIFWDWETCFSWGLQFCSYVRIIASDNWRLNRACEQLYDLRRVNLRIYIQELIAPDVTFMGLALAFPYLFAHGLIPVLINEFETIHLIQRVIYPIVLLSGLVKPFRKLYERIKIDRYMVGRRLVNYNR